MLCIRNHYLGWEINLLTDYCFKMYDTWLSWKQPASVSVKSSVITVMSFWQAFLEVQFFLFFFWESKTKCESKIGRSPSNLFPPLSLMPTCTKWKRRGLFECLANDSFSSKVMSQTVSSCFWRIQPWQGICSNCFGCAELEGWVFFFIGID